MIRVESPAFEHNGPIPKKYAGEGEDVSPPLRWSEGPNGTKSYALICDDPDAPQAEPWVHWVAYDIDSGVTRLGEGDANGAKEGVNDFRQEGYGGPMPPEGHGTHHYHFKVYALDTPVDMKPGATKAELEKAMSGHILDEGEVVGTYER